MAKRKLRTRDHINADLSENFVERIALKKGFSVEKVEHDYGYDLIVFTYNSVGEIENGEIYFQLKAKEDLSFVKDDKFISYQVDVRDINLWKDQPYPVIFVVYDAQDEQAYWLYIQDYIQKHDILNTSRGLKKISVNIPRSNMLDASSMETIAGYKADALLRIKNSLKGI